MGPISSIVKCRDMGIIVLRFPKMGRLISATAVCRRNSIVTCKDRSYDWFAEYRKSIGDESREFRRAGCVPKFLKCLRFDLTNPLTGHAEFLTDLFESMIGRVADTKTHT